MCQLRIALSLSHQEHCFYLATFITKTLYIDSLICTNWVSDPNIALCNIKRLWIFTSWVGVINFEVRVSGFVYYIYCSWRRILEPQIRANYPVARSQLLLRKWLCHRRINFGQGLHKKIGLLENLLIGEYIFTSSKNLKNVIARNNITNPDFNNLWYFSKCWFFFNF